MKPAESYEAEFQRIIREMKQVEIVVIVAMAILIAIGAWMVLR